MRISAKYKIAVDAMLDIAAHTEKGFTISLPLVSKRLGISHSYLEQIFSKLKTAGLIDSHRGPGGGYSLAKKPEDISVKDIVAAAIDPQSLANNPSTQLWLNLEVHMQNQMSQISLSHILANTPIKIDPALESLGAKLARAQERKKHSHKVAMKNPDSKAQCTLGPNSVFSFGKFIFQK